MWEADGWSQSTKFQADHRFAAVVDHKQIQKSKFE
jgi:hypothetical protein